MKSSEKRLLAILLVLLVLGAGAFGYREYSNKLEELRTEESQLELEWVEIEALFEEKQTWELRGEWLERNQPAFSTPEKASQELFDTAQAKNRSGLKTSKQTLLPITNTSEYVEAGVALTAIGDLATILRWVHDITSPKSFRSVRNLTIRPNRENPTEVEARFELLRWFAPNATE